ncbi:MAG: type III pantothenate kinase [Bacteroidales bacterium]|nr:type III pantothenate kinase [Bacteroidales bacterium]
MMETNLLVDIGNTNAKVVFYYNGTMGRLRRSSERDAVAFVKSVIESTEYQVNTIVVSNVRTANEPVREALTPLCKRLIVLDYKTPLPIDLGYGFDATELGADRIAAALAVAVMFKGQDCIKFDFGTALTVDFIDKNGHYLGGNISLGMRSRFRALNEFTGLLPFITPDPEFPPMGVTTTGAMSAGVVFGLIFEVEGYIKRYPQHTIIFTGGDSFYFAHKIKNTVFATQDMVLQGLALIADYYLENEKD